LATYGEGDPTDNAQEFYEWLREDGRDLNNLHYAVIFISIKKKDCDVFVFQGIWSW
jgi:NADPH-ferrihemoprotein reductase